MGAIAGLRETRWERIMGAIAGLRVCARDEGGVAGGGELVRVVGGAVVVGGVKDRKVARPGHCAPAVLL